MKCPVCGSEMNNLWNDTAGTSDVCENIRECPECYTIDEFVYGTSTIIVDGVSYDAGESPNEARDAIEAARLRRKNRGLPCN